MTAKIPSMRICVVGGGMSGIAAAYFIAKQGIEVELLEAETRLGGRVGCDRLGDKLIEFGGKNIGRDYRLFRQFVNDMGKFEYEFFGINTSTVANGKIHEIRSERPLRSLINVARLTGVKDFVRIAALVSAVRRNSRNGFLGGEYFRRLSEKWDNEPLSSHFGERACKQFLRPLLVRMNGAEAHEYYAGALGSNLKMILDTYDQLCDGFSPVIDAFAKRVKIVTGVKVHRLIVRDGAVTGVVQSSGAHFTENGYDGVVLATPAAITASIVRESLPELAGELDKVRYNPVAVAIARYRRDIFPPQRRAIVFDDRFELSNAGAYGINDRDIVRYTFSGGLATQHIDKNTDADHVIALGEKHLASHFSVHADDRTGFVYRYFRHGLCAYAPYHHRILDAVDATTQNVYGLGITGDYIRGASIEACFRAAYEASEKLCNRLPSSHVSLRRVS